MPGFRFPLAAVVTLASVSVGVLLGTATVGTQGRVNDRLQIYSNALAQIEENYVEPLDKLCTTPDVCGTESLVYSSIEGMLRTLDPHSSFFSPR